MAKSQRYARLMGDFWRHARTSQLSPMAAGILCRAWSYCADQATDGSLPKALVFAFFGGSIDEAVIAELEEAGVWTSTAEGWQMRDWTQHNVSRADWEAKKAQTRERVRRHRERQSEADQESPQNTDDAPGNAVVTRYSNAGNAPVTDDEDEDEGRELRPPHSPPSDSSIETPLDPSDPSPPASPPALPGLSLGEAPKAKGRPKSTPPEVAEVFEHWRVVMGKTAAAKLDRKRRRRIDWALAEYGLAAAKRCIDGYALSAWHMGQNPSGTRYNDLTFVFRDATNLEKGLEFAHPPKPVAIAGSRSLVQSSHRINAPETTLADAIAQYEAQNG